MLYTCAWFKSTTGPRTVRIIHTEELKSFALQFSICVYVSLQHTEEALPQQYCINEVDPGYECEWVNLQYARVYTSLAHTSVCST